MGDAILSAAISLAARIVFPVGGAYFRGIKTPFGDSYASPLCKLSQKVIIFRVVSAGVGIVSQILPQ